MAQPTLFSVAMEGNEWSDVCGFSIAPCFMLAFPQTDTDTKILSARCLFEKVIPGSMSSFMPLSIFS